MENITAIVAIIPDWLLAISALVTAATGITALTPTQIDDRYLGYVGKAINFMLRITNMVAGNIGKNKNADDVA